MVHRTFLRHSVMMLYNQVTVKFLIMLTKASSTRAGATIVSILLLFEIMINVICGIEKWNKTQFMFVHYDRVLIIVLIIKCYYWPLFEYEYELAYIYILGEFGISSNDLKKNNNKNCTFSSSLHSRSLEENLRTFTIFVAGYAFQGGRGQTETKFDAKQQLCICLSALTAYFHCSLENGN